VYFIGLHVFLSDGGAPKRRGTRGSLSPLYSILSTGLDTERSTNVGDDCKQQHIAFKVAAKPLQIETQLPLTAY